MSGRRIAITLALASLLLLTAAYWLPIHAWTLGFINAVRAAGSAGIVLYSAAFLLTSLLLLPAGVMTMAAGFLYGLIPGTLIVLPVSQLSALIAFWLARHFLRARVERACARRPNFQALDRALGAHAFRVALLVRLSPIFPFGLSNYALGITPIRTGPYLLASIIGAVPMSLLYVYLGSVVARAQDLLSGERPIQLIEQIAFWSGLAITAVATVYLTSLARRALQRELKSS